MRSPGSSAPFRIGRMCPSRLGWPFARSAQLQVQPPKPGYLPVRSPEDLLQPHKSKLNAIRTLVGVPETHWNNLYYRPLYAFAAFVQLLPASEAHHHSGPGGMLEHGLMVAINALRLRRGKLLPPGACAEELSAKQDLWTYATATAALLHDIGKPVTDQKVTLYDSKGQDIGIWDPWQGPIVDPAAWYEVGFKRGRRHNMHQRIAPLLARAILPTDGIAWLASDPDAFSAWTATLVGDMDAAGAIGELISKADGLSVAANLAGEQTQVPTARTKPLHRRLLTGLRFLLDQGELPLNKDGAAGWLVGDDLWLVVKRALDAVREHLNREGHQGIPSRNERLMDELQQFGAVIANGDKAVWKVTVFAKDWPNAHTLTVLRFHADRLWPDPDARPAPFDGAVTPVADDEASVPANQEQEPSRQTEGENSTTRPTTTDKGSPTIPVTQKPQATQRPGGQSQKENKTQATEAKEENYDPGIAFLDWLRQGITTRSFEINSVNARIHMVPEGMLLVSPAIFKDFDRENWETVQKRFTKLRLHQRRPDGTNIHTYTVTSTHKKSRIRGYLLPNPKAAFPTTSLPDPNVYLSPLS